VSAADDAPGDVAGAGRRPPSSRPRPRPSGRGPAGALAARGGAPPAAPRHGDPRGPRRAGRQLAARGPAARFRLALPRALGCPHSQPRAMTAALRRLYVPRPARVEADPAGRPTSVEGIAVEALREEWLVEDRWWTSKPLGRRYFELVLADGSN